MVLRLSVPSGDGFRALAVDLAAKVAEYVGCAPPDTTKVAAILESLAAEVTPNGADGGHHVRVPQVDEELRIEAACSGRKSEASHSLADADSVK